MLIPPITYLRSVSIHVPARGTTRRKVRVYVRLFQSTFPQGERLYCAYHFIQVVSIHVPARGTTLAQICPATQVSIHVPARGTTPFAPCLGRKVSIHVPARGTTVCRPCNKRRSRFQSTFPQGERPQRTPLSGVKGFNPRSRKGNDVTLMQWLQHGVSIHVPARGTTHLSNAVVHQRFQSTFPQGERRFLEDENIPVRFQSTFPQGERRRESPDSGKPIMVSIHVPARGTTGNRRLKSYRGFNPRSRKGNDSGCSQVSGQKFQGFNPRSRKGNDDGKNYIVITWSFNPRSRKGNDIAETFIF